MSSYYDVANMDMKPMAERCREYYNAEDFVVVMNIDTKPFTYVIQRPENVTINQPSPVTKELYYTKDPDVITLEPGQTRLVPAYEADHFIKQLVDNMVLRGRGVAIANGDTPSESTNDPATQHKYIKQIYQGKKDFMAEYNNQLTQAETPAVTSGDNLRELLAAELEGDDNEPVNDEAAKSAGRTKKQVA